MPQPPPSRASQTTPGARRPPRRKGDLTGQAIRDVLAGLLAGRALAEITVDEIAKGAGISRSAFYFHYESREAVLHALTEQITDDLYTSGTAWFRRTDESPGDALRRAISQTVALWREHGPVLRASVRARDTDPSLAPFWTEVARRFIGAVADQIDRERAAGIAIAGPPSARRLAALLVTMNEQACYNHSLTRRSRTADTEFIEALCAVWIRAVYGTV
ncbi:MAG TPA: TetR/AcrR family transcriptional regulator [Pseudonocardiaceae bacterium]|jgi:AcrR family transcriptional regulator|nr:TetR/AcrR family transcriptional regulator [Pseudonocardiaceae bacterium]